ncbi:LLM class flavin-dependent oxidoreductase [Spirillospora sp. CA-142024]|uniref:LLM class flavin-dependent oxidoreductase n=1 Tax=Spirillospora sp. CA-142024 TaxID=3240036 RepID=UPI003D8EBF49
MITKMAVTPSPLQSPLPLWRVIDSPRSIRWAAERGVQGMFWLPPVSALKERFELYRDVASESSGREYALGEGIGLVRDVYVADTMEQARREFEEAVMTSYRWCTWGRTSTTAHTSSRSRVQPLKREPPVGQRNAARPGAHYCSGSAHGAKPLLRAAA